MFGVDSMHGLLYVKNTLFLFYHSLHFYACHGTKSRQYGLLAFLFAYDTLWLPGSIVHDYI